MASRHILFVASESQVSKTREALGHFGAKKSDVQPDDNEVFELVHSLFDGMTVRITLMSDLSGLTPHLRCSPVDLLVYDERAGKEAVAALETMKEEIVELAKMWGPDFLFPLKRAVVILKGGADAAHRAFELGRDHVRDVLIEPERLSHTVKWLAKILRHGMNVDEHRAGLALGGGGIEGMLFQLGTVHALNSALEGRQLDSLEVFSGVSSGSILATMLASGVPLREIIASINGTSEILPPLKSSTVFDLAVSDILQRMGRNSLKLSDLNPRAWLNKFLRNIPTGFFRGDRFVEFLNDTLNAYGAPLTFGQLDKELFVGVTDQDSFEHEVFSQETPDISLAHAVRASCALPPFFTPLELNGRKYVDGQITRTCNLELMVKNSCHLVIIVDPLKPYPARIPGTVDREGGAYALIQTVKALVYTRFQASLRHLTDQYPDVDFIILQPDEECAQAMAGSPMRYKIRAHLVEMAYKNTLRRLRERHSVYSAKFAKYDLHLKTKRQISVLEKTGII